MMRTIVAVCSLVLLLLLDRSLATATTTAELCASNKFKAAGSDYARKNKCHSRAAVGEFALVDNCFVKSADKFDAAFSRAEKNGACPGDADTIEAQIDACVTELAATLSTTGCPPGQATSVHGTVTAPNGTLPIPNAIVFVPKGPVGSLPAGPTCERCGTVLGATPLVQTTTSTTGTFTLAGVPAGTNVPLVVQIGKWRRQIVVPNVPACTNTAVAASLTRLPKNRAEGDLPSIAVSTGNAGSVECLLRKVGIADTEFATPPSAARVHLFAGFGGTDQFDAGVSGGAPFLPATSLWSSTSTLEPYDLVLLSCEGAQHAETKSADARLAMKNYADRGGRVYLEHWHNIWLASGPNPSPSIITFNNLAELGDFTADVDTSPGRNATFADWLVATGASTTRGKLNITSGKHTAVSVDSTIADRMIYKNAVAAGDQPSVQYATFTTPVDQPAANRCGRVLFTDIHASQADTSNSNLTFPSGGCIASTTTLTPQEKALVFALFDLGSCVGSPAS